MKTKKLVLRLDPHKLLDLEEMAAMFDTSVEDLCRQIVEHELRFRFYESLTKDARAAVAAMR